MIVRLHTRALLHLTGADTRPFLQGLLTHDLDLLTPARPLWAGLLSPQGKTLFDLLLFDDDAGGVLIDHEAARTAELAKRLTVYRLKRAVVLAPSALAVLAALPGDDVELPADPRLLALGARGPGEPGAHPPGDAAHTAHRRGLGVPEGAAELGVDRTLWLEANAVELGGVSFTKGCYVGQENTARMHHRDRVRRRLLPVRLAADPGGETAIVGATGRAVGELRAHADGLGIAHLRVEDAAAPLTLAGGRVDVLWPAWLPARDASPDAAETA